MTRQIEIERGWCTATRGHYLSNHLDIKVSNPKAQQVLYFLTKIYKNKIHCLKYNYSLINNYQNMSISVVTKSQNREMLRNVQIPNIFGFKKLLITEYWISSTIWMLSQLFEYSNNSWEHWCQSIVLNICQMILTDTVRWEKTKSEIWKK